jgi:hypothetical protein
MPGQWFPAYWEYTCAIYVDPQNPFWADPVDQFLTPMPADLRMESIRGKYFGDFLTTVSICLESLDEL